MPLTQVDQGLLSSTAQYTGFKNRIINGGMVIAQRGNVAVTQAAVAYGGADRFAGYPNYAGGGSATLAQTVVTWTNSGYAQGFTSASATGAGSVLFFQRIEAKNCVGLAGNKATLSFKIAHDYGSSCDVVIRIVRPTTTADDFSSQTTIFGDTTIGSVASTTSSGTSLTYTIPTSFTTTDVSKGLQISISVNTAATYSGKNFYLGDVQFEVGSTATSFDYRPYGTELALCQRYYCKLSGTGRFGMGYNATTTEGTAFINFPVTMRIPPTALEQSGTASDYGVQVLGSTGTCSSVPTFQGASSNNGTAVSYFQTGLVAGQGGVFSGKASGNAYLGFSAEL